METMRPAGHTPTSPTDRPYVITFATCGHRRIEWRPAELGAPGHGYIDLCYVCWKLRETVEPERRPPTFLQRFIATLTGRRR